MNFLKKVVFDSRGLVPVIIQDIKTGEVLMLAWINKDKGEISGHYQLVKEIYLDCDGDTLLIKVEQVKAACHLGYKSCFFRKLSKKGEWEIVKEKVFEPKKVYNSLKSN